MSQLLKRFRSDVIGLFWLALSLFTTLSLATFSPHDPSFNSLGHNLHVKNACGFVGSFFADLALQVFGVSSWIFVLVTLSLSIRGFRRVNSSGGIHRPFLVAGLTLALASLLALYFPNVRFWGQISIGGVVGKAISQALLKALNPLGVTLFLWTLTVSLLIFYTEKSLQELAHWPWLALKEGVAWLWSRRPRWPQLSKQATKEQAADAPMPKAEEAPLPNRFFPIKEAPSALAQMFSIAPAHEEKRKVVMKVKVPQRVENWDLPKLQLLEDPPLLRYKIDEREIKEKAKLLTEKLAQFSVRGSVVGVKPGPAVTLFEFKPAADVKISKITELADDLSLALSSESVRIIAPIPGRDVVGIETSNAQREGVYLKDILAQDAFWEDDCKLPLALGRKADGEPRVMDLRKMPHLLVAGTTGSGKSVFVVSMLTGLIFRHSPKSLRLILVDPKQVDLAAFSQLPHLIMPPIREAKKAVGALRWAIREMEKRYRSMSLFGARGLEAFNEIAQGLSKAEKAEHEKANETKIPQESYYFEELPYLVIVVEEFGDLMAVDKINVEQCVVRLAQMARACGIHLVLAMQSPRKDVVTGLIKTNIPGRVSFKVASKMDSRIILDEAGAERLLARGDMLFLAPGVSKPERHHGPYLSETEIASLVDFWSQQGQPQFDPIAMKAIENSGGGFDLSENSEMGDEEFLDDDIRDDRYDEVLAYVASQKEVSASLLQRKFRLGYPRAARMIEIFESEGVIGPANGSKPRQVLVSELK